MVSESVNHLVFSSTCAIFGNPIETPIPEDHPTRPINAYGETKLAVERALEHYERAYGLKSIKFRYFNAAGADPEGGIGEDHSPEIHLIPNAIRAAEKGEALEIYGDDYPTPDGTCQRDYVHVSDLSSAHLLALEALQSGASSTAYNLGNGRPHSVHEVVSAVERVSGSRVEFRVGDRRAGDPAVLFASSDRVKEELGWQPQHAEIDVIVGTALRWHRSHPDGFEAASGVSPASVQHADRQPQL
jgi:UDP-glucose-4-epimerase GalE